ncbi:PTS sugar transporter subunit IIA [Primorskyibacter sp. S187A]|uniref:PTS sugar transporter subunit IIA n=1 Tax=Primorskyibacter sp. S187A TaxID=3415130 RepID=UPI003C7AE3C5
MDLSSLLPARGVKVMSMPSSKKRLMNEIAELAASTYDLDASVVLEALLDRESLGPTGVGQGVALPHARLPDLERCVGVFILLETPIDFDAVDRQPVDILFGLFAPEDAGVEHLKALALVSRTLRETAFCTKLRANSDPATLHAILTEGEDVKAA